MTTGKPSLWPLSVEAYHALGQMGLIPEKTELICGQVFRKMPKSPRHRVLSQRLLRLLLALNPEGRFIWQEQPLTCAISEPEPDIAVIAGDEEEFRDRHPSTAELVIEVCVSSYEYDREKLGVYAAAGVKECWLVLAPEKRVEVYTNPLGDRYGQIQRIGPGGTLDSTMIAGFTVSLDRLFAE